MGFSLMCAAQRDAEAADNGQPEDLRAELVDSLLSDTREELGRADGKASILLSAAGVVVSVLLAGAISRDWNPTQLASFEWLWWLGTLSGACAIVALGWAIWPRVNHPAEKGKLTYFGHVASFKTVDELSAALDRRVSAASPQSRPTDQLHTVSKIVDKKYRRIRWGIGLFGAALLICTAAVALGQLSG